jgi:hypothetical protein
MLAALTCAGGIAVSTVTAATASARTRAPAGTAPAAAAPTGSAPAANRALASASAAALLRHTPRPAGATRSQTEPAGDGKLLGHPPPTPATHTLVDRDALYVVASPLRSVEHFYLGHRPAQARPDGTGDDTGPGVPANVYLTWAWPAGSPAIASRETLVELVALPGRRTGIRIDAQVVYRVPRPAAERVPAGVGAVSITRAKPGQVPDLSRTVTGPARVQKITSMIDRLPIVQPGEIACPVLLAGTPVVTFTFAATPGGSALATASEPADVTEPTSACDALTFATGAHAWPSLLHGARFLHRVDRLVHARFATAPGAAAPASTRR